MFWFLAIAIGLLISIADYFLLADDKRMGTFIRIILRDVLTINLTSFFLMKNFFNVSNIFMPNAHRPSFIWKYAGLALAVGVVLWCIIEIGRASCRATVHLKIIKVLLLLRLFQQFSSHSDLLHTQAHSGEKRLLVTLLPTKFL